MNPEPSPLAGKTGSYQPEAIATRGSHAVIWRACRRDGTSVAIKVRDRESGFPIAWLEQEGSLLQELTHQGVPGIVPLLDILEWNGEPALVFTWYPLTLGNLEKPDWARLRPLLATVGKALMRLHQLGWIHGDVTPGNILLDSSGQSPCLTDFGLAKRLGDGVAADPGSNISATPGFSDPRHPTPGPRTDWHSLAVCAWLLATGNMPPGQATWRQLVQLAREKDLPETVAWDLAWWLAKGSSPRRLLRWLEGKKRRLVPGRYRPLLQPGMWLMLGLLVLAILLLLQALWTYLTIR